jgi:large subunit ribosomal protein L15
MQLHNISLKNKKKKRVGRGGKRGTYAGRGGKGQTARSGHRIRPAIRDYLKQIPKQRGRHKHSFKSRVAASTVVSIGTLESAFLQGAVVTPKALIAKGLVVSFGSRIPRIKILGDGRIAKKFTVQGCLVSKSARAAIEKAGGIIK